MAFVIADHRELCQVGNPEKRERDSGMKVNTDSAMKPISFTPIQKRVRLDAGIMP